MPLSFRIFPEHDLCLVRYRGALRIDETLAVFEAYARHPGYRPGQKQLIDLTDVTDIEQDFPGLMKLQAHKAGRLHGVGWQVLVAYLATEPGTLRLAQRIQRSWDGIDGVVTRVFTDADAALDFLGVPSGRIAELSRPGEN